MTNSASPDHQSQAVAQQLETFVSPLLVTLEKRLDKRLVRTFLLTLCAILTFRHHRYGLLLSELGGYILSPSQAPAGTKRISNLLRSSRWSYWIIGRFLWKRATDFVEQQSQDNDTPLVIWDESVVEKPESIALEGLCAVRSSKAARLKRIKKGYFNPPGGRPIFVPGMQWMSIIVVGMSGTPLLAIMKWWTTRGKLQRRSVRRRLSCYTVVLTSGNNRSSMSGIVALPVRHGSVKPFGFRCDLCFVGRQNIIWLMPKGNDVLGKSHAANAVWIID